MRWMITLLPLVAWTLLFAGASSREDQDISAATPGAADTAKEGASLASFVEGKTLPAAYSYSLASLEGVLKENKIAQFELGLSRENRKINAFYFSGTSSQRALVIGGVHGSELSSVEVAYELLKQLVQGEPPFYSVIIIPALFPDNAVKAMEAPGQIGSMANIGRYTFPSSVDPNRQMPSPGKGFAISTGTDHLGRSIEPENQLLLQLIQSFRPTRIVSLHAIRNTDCGGVYSDPRTDHRGIALGYESDSSLAITIARYIQEQGGNVNGNKLDKRPTALYYKDPQPVQKGFLQKRNMTGSALNAHRGSGVSLGTWASTAVIDEKDPSRNREAIRILTIEYPGYRRPIDYDTEAEQLRQQRQVEIFASAIYTLFLGNYFPEEENADLTKR